MNVQELLIDKRLDYRISGPDYLVRCLNPEHDDTNPSMRIDQVLGIFNCMSCGFKGNIFHLFGENYDQTSAQREKLKRKLSEVRSSSTGHKIPSDAIFVEENYRVSKETLTDFEAFRSLQPDFAGRIVFPIYDIKSKIVCFIGRAEEDYQGKAKYKVSPAKSKVPLFPLHRVEPCRGRVLLVEGLFDLLNLYEGGFRNALACFGTNTVNSEKLSLLKMLGISGIDICFDPDEAGRNAAESVKELCEKEQLQARIVKLPNCDPGDLPLSKVQKLKERLYG